MASSFDLFRNPFVLLRLDLSASSKQVSEAFEDAVADGVAPEPELVVARQAMLAPMLRLEAEVGALPDTPSPEWRSILVALKSSQALPSLRQAFEKVASLSRSNLLTHAASRAQPDAPTFAAWIRAQSEVDLDKIYSEIEQFREIAGVVRPDRTALASSLSSLREKQARALFEGFKSPPDAIHAITICTKEEISNAVTTQIDVLSTLLSAYGRYIEQELSFRRERVTNAARGLQSDPDAPGNLEILIDALKFWNQADQPLQLLESHKGRDEPTAQELFQEIRTLAISLANDQSRFDVALSITKACQEIFAKLPRATQTLSEDCTDLEERIVSSKVDPLAVAINQLGDDLIQSAEDDIIRLDKALGPKLGSAIGDLENRLARQREALRLSHEADTRRSVCEEGRLIRQEVSRIRNSPGNLRSSLRSEIDELVEGFSIVFANSPDPKVTAQVHRLAGLARDALMKDDRSSIEDARRSLDEIRAIVFSDLARRPGFWVGMFEDLAKDRHRAIDKAKHEQFVREGEARIRSEDVDGLRQVTFQIRDNMVKSAEASTPDVLAGLMR